MKIEPGPFALASAIAAALLWLVCSVIVFIIPGPMMGMSGHMVHANLSGMNWALSLTGILVGLIGWGLIAGIFAWLLAYSYNMLARN